MSSNSYPKLIIRTDSLYHNALKIKKMADANHIRITGAIKGCNGIYECAETFLRAGIDTLASSRLEQLEELRDKGITSPFMMLRLPMKSEADRVVKICDISMNSEKDTLISLNEAAKKAGLIHKVILMADVGDLREGFWEKAELLETARLIEENLKNLYFAGIGTNIGCYGSVDSSPATLQKLVDIAIYLEENLGHKLDIISGGATSSLKRLIDGNLPNRINHLRIGEGVLNAIDLEKYHGYDMSFLKQDVFTLQAEIIEIKDKPSHPIGDLVVDAFGKKPIYTDRGIRKRAIVALGKVDYGMSIEEIFPKSSGIEILGASSDHTILDIEDNKDNLRVGDIVEFDINYGSMVFLTASRNVSVEYIN